MKEPPNGRQIGAALRVAKAAEKLTASPAFWTLAGALGGASAEPDGANRVLALLPLAQDQQATREAMDRLSDLIMATTSYSTAAAPERSQKEHAAA